MNMRHTIGCLVLAAGLMVGAVGCDKGKSAANGTKAPTVAAVIPAGYFVEKEPASAMGITELKKSAKAGDKVVMRGRIAGRKDPFTSGRAEFMMTDMSLAVCEDGCTTPWDHCCESSKDVAGNAATVQIVDDKGEVIKGDAKGVHGLQPNTELVVVGKVKSLDEAGNLVVDAVQVYLVTKG